MTIKNATTINLPTSAIELKAMIKIAIEHYKGNETVKENKLNESLAKSLNFKNFNSLSSLLKNENNPKIISYKNKTFEIPNSSGEHEGRKALVTESDCDLHIKVENYTISLQNTHGDLKLTIEDSNQLGVEIENISLPCKAPENNIDITTKVKPNNINQYNNYLSAEYISMSSREKAIDMLKAVINKMNYTTLSFNQVEHYVGSDTETRKIHEWIDDTRFFNKPISPEEVLELCDGFEID
jgi:hypothetical protein